MESPAPVGAGQRLASLRIDLPEVPRALPNFVPWRRHGDLIFLTAQNCVLNGEVIYGGKVGEVHDLDAARKAARICALNLLAALKEALDGDLDRVRACLRVGGFVNCTTDFPSVPHAINGASDLILDVFGPDIGAHARTAIGVAQLPQNASVAVEAVFAVDGPRG